MLSGCGDEPTHFPVIDDPVVDVDGPIAEMEITDRELEVIRFVLNSDDDRHGDRIYFLTTSPMSNWAEAGNWKALPAGFHRSIVELQTKYKSANEAYLVDGHVREKSTAAPAWMKWITIKQWISPTEVEVESGVWTGPLGGGASTVVYEKVDGTWRLKSSAGGWVS